MFGGMFGGNNRKKSAEAAKNRLKLVLVTDRTGFSDDKIEAIRKDLLEVLARHLDLDLEDENLDINITKDTTHFEGSPALVASIPIKGMRDR